MPARRRNQPDLWYIAAFGEHYLRVYAHRDERDAARAAAFAMQVLNLKRGESLLDLCCGAGRHVAQFAALGVRVIGLDLSAPLLAHAREEGISAPLVRADARWLPFKNASFDYAVNLFTSFGYFDDARDDVRMVGELARILKRGSRVIFDIMNPAYTLGKLIPESTEARPGMRLEIKRRHDRISGRVEKNVHVTFDDGLHDVNYTESVRLYDASTFDALLAHSGFRMQERFGDFDGVPFGPDSPRQIVIAVNRA